MSPLVSPYFAAVLVLGAAGFMKVVTPASTRVALREAGLPGTLVVARSLGVAELVLAAWALVGGGAPAAAGVAVAYLGFAAFSTLVRHRTHGRASCGCFGRWDAPITKVHVGINLVLATAATALVADPVGASWSVASDSPAGGVPLVGVTALLACLIVVLLTGRSKGARGLGIRHQVPSPPNGEHLGGAVDIRGRSPRGDDPVSVRVTGVEHDTIVAFLSSNCITCQVFWDTFGRHRKLGLSTQTRLVVVTKDPQEESVSAVSELAPPGVPTVMSTEAFSDYDVPGSPYFVHIHGPTGQIRGQVTGADWEQVSSLLAQPPGDAEA